MTASSILRAYYNGLSLAGNKAGFYPNSRTSKLISVYALGEVAADNAAFSLCTEKAIELSSLLSVRRAQNSMPRIRSLKPTFTDQRMLLHMIQSSQLFRNIPSRVPIHRITFK